MDNADGSDPSVGSTVAGRDDAGFGITSRKELMDLQLMTVDEVAAKLAVGKTTVYMLMSSGRLPSVKIGEADASASPSSGTSSRTWRKGMRPGLSGPDRD